MSKLVKSHVVIASRARQIAHRWSNLPPYLYREVSQRLEMTAGEAGDIVNILAGDGATFRVNFFEDMEAIMDQLSR